MDIEIRVSGMTCAHCVQSVTSELMQISDIEHVAIDLSTGTVAISANGAVDQSEIVAAIAEAGYSVVK